MSQSGSYGPPNSQPGASTPGVNITSGEIPPSSGPPAPPSTSAASVSPSY